MAEFKVSDAITTEISDVNSSGTAINNTYADVSSDGVDTLKTSQKILAQHYSIKELLELYKALVQKDVSDLNAMVTEAQNMDASISSSHNT